jgi:N-acetylmuramoyl-L-alanine amidase
MDKPWVPYVVQQGDHLDGLAFRFGTDPDTLWSNPNNKDLAATRKNRDTLAPGDVLYVPGKPAPSLQLHAGIKNTFTARVPKVPIKLRVQSDREVKGKKFEVHGAGGQKPLEGTVSSEGDVSFDVPVYVREVLLRIREAGIVLPLAIGALDPKDEPSGVAQRLRNLGYLPRAKDVSAETLASAIAAFQRDHRLEVTGVIDDETRDALEQAYAR